MYVFTYMCILRPQVASCPPVRTTRPASRTSYAQSTY